MTSLAQQPRLILPHRGYYVTKPRSKYQGFMYRWRCVSTAELDLRNLIASSHQIKCHEHQDRMPERRRDQRSRLLRFEQSLSTVTVNLVYTTSISYKL